MGVSGEVGLYARLPGRARGKLAEELGKVVEKGRIFTFFGGDLPRLGSYPVNFCAASGRGIGGGEN